MTTTQPAPRTSVAPPEQSAGGIGVPSPPERGWPRWVPGLWVLAHYKREWFAKDLVAGLVVSALLVPAGLGYATAAGLPPITGLYATIVPLIAYALFGPSRIMVLGPDSALAALIAAAVVQRAGGDSARAVGLASLLALLTGLLCVGAGLARVGFVTDLLSRPVRVGYMNGIALTVLVAQLPKLFGFSVRADSVFDGAVRFATSVAQGQTKPAALAIGAVCLATIVMARRVAPKFPAVLVAVVGATLAVRALGLGGSISVVGAVPRGFPSPTLPPLSASLIGELLVASAGIMLVAYADMSVLSRTFAGRNHYRVDPNQELVGLGVANIAAAFFQGFPVTSSASRTPVAESAGSRTQVTGVVGAVTIVLVLVAAPTLLRDLPTAALAAVVIAAALRSIDVDELRVFARVRRSDFTLSILAFVAVVTFGVLWGIALSVTFSLLDFVRRAWRPHDAILGRAEGVKGYHDVTRYRDAREIPGLLMYRWDAPLFFANADTFRARIIELVDQREPKPRWVVVAAEPITDVDTTAAEALLELDNELFARGIELVFAEMKDPVKDRLERYGLQQKIGREFFFATLGVAVKTYLARYSVPWTDWDEEKGGE
ncbi:MAG: sulfate permease [Myxococcales bacterium]|nr:sulfate permease [Myxococcales bacterium]